MRAVAKVQADQLADDLRLCLGVFAQARREAFDQAAARFLRGVVIGDVQPARQQIAQQSVGLQPVLRMRAAHQQRRARRARQQPRSPLGQQPCLAEAGVGDQSDGLQSPFRRCLAKQAFDFSEFGIAPDQRRAQAFYTARTLTLGQRPRATNDPGQQRFIAALDLEPRLRFALEGTGHLAPRGLADPQGTHRRALFHARGDVHRHAPDAAFGIHAATEQHRPGVDAHAHVEAFMPVAQPDLLALRAAFFQHRQAGTHRAFGVVFSCFVGTEHGQQAVAGVLQHAASLGLHPRRELLKGAVHDGVHVFRVQVLAQRGGADDVGKQHGDLFQLLVELALQRINLGPQRSESRVDHDIAEHPALRF